MDSNHVAVLDAEVVANNTVDAGAAVIKLIIGKDDEDGILSLLASYQDGITTEELEFLHGSLRESDDAVVIVDSIGNPDVRLVWSSIKGEGAGGNLHKLVRLLLLLQDGGSGVIFLHRC